LDRSLSGQNFRSIQPHHDQNCTFLDFLLNSAQATVPIHGQKCNKNHLWAKTFPTSPSTWGLIAWNLDFPANNGKASKWKIFMPRLKPIKDKKRVYKNTENQNLWTKISRVTSCTFFSKSWKSKIHHNSENYRNIV
jgi:hypothetical protein